MAQLTRRLLSNSFGVGVRVRKQSCGNNNEKRLTCTLIPGDGIGPELICNLKHVFKSIDVPLDFEEIIFSEVYDKKNSAKLEDVIKSVAKNKLCIKGYVAYGKSGVKIDANSRFRRLLDLYANVVHVRSLPGVNTRHKDIDTVIIREQTEGEYSALEHESVPGVVECLKIITAEKSLRIAKFAFDYASLSNRKKVTAVHKANIMKLGDGLFLNSCEQMSKLYPKIKFDKMIVDNTSMQIVAQPNQFDIMVMPNLYGNIITNIATGLVGGPGLVSGVSYSQEVVVVEPGARHLFGSAVGKNIANPIAMLLCGTKLLRHIHLYSYSDRIEKAILKVLKDGKVRTQDIGGKSSTTDFIDCIVDTIE